jgi:hypothetical protein
MFEALFKGVSTRFGLRTIEKYIENPDFIFCQSFPKSSFGEHKSATFFGSPQCSAPRAGLLWGRGGLPVAVALATVTPAQLLAEP